MTIPDKSTLKLEGKRIYLRILKVADVGESYVRWMNDEEILQYTECRGRTFTAEDLRTYVQDRYDNPADYFFGIFLNDSRIHAGNIKLGNIKPADRSADIGLILDKEHWHQGYASESIRLATDFAFRELGLNRVWAGMSEENQNSYKAFVKNGFKKFNYDAGKKVIQVEILKSDEKKAK